MSTMNENESPKKGLGAVSLVLGIIGGIMFAYVAMQFLRWGVFAFLGNAATMFWLSVVVNVAAWIVGAIADYQEYKDAGLASIGSGIAKTCLGIAVAFFVYVRFIA